MIKNFLFFAFVSLITIQATAQVFNTAKTLKKSTFSVGVEPMIIASGADDFLLFGHAGYGLTSGIDLGFKFGVLGSTSYVGGDVEFGINKNFSFSAGAHTYGDFGLDATFLGTYELAKNVNLFGGLDADVNFGGNVYFPVWIPLGCEIELNKSMAFVFEASIGVYDSAPHMFGGGVNFYF